MALAEYHELHPLDSDEVKSILQAEIAASVGAEGDDLSAQRAKSLKYYLGEPFGNEVEGRSSVVLHDVADTIEWAMPNLMQMLVPGNTVARFTSKNQEQADQATAYGNHVLMQENKGYKILHGLFKTGLLEKTGYLQVYIDERTEPKIDSYFGLNNEELEILLGEHEGEPIAHNEYTENLPIEDPSTGETVDTPTQLHDVRLRVTRTVKRIRVDGVPPEEMMKRKDLVELDDECPFIGRRRKVKISDLIAWGYPRDDVLSLPSDDSMEFNEERQERKGEEADMHPTGSDRMDPASREVWINDCYIHIDEDGDGYAELRNIVCVGESSVVVLKDEEVNWIPFCYVTPVPMPHKFDGLSLSDMLMDLQLIRSTLLRQTLDNMYVVNNSRVEVVEGQVNTDDLMVSRPGGIVRVRAPGMVKPLEVRPLGPMAFHMLEFTEGVKENRTGITRYSQGQDSQSLNKTATGVSKIMGAAFARVASIAKLYAEDGLKRLFKLILRSAIEGGFKERVVRLRGKWVSVDPRSWNADMDVQVEVGLGVGQEGERIGHLKEIIGLQGEAVERGFGGYLVEPQHFFNAVSDLTLLVGMREPDRYFADPAVKGPPPPPPPDPKIEIEKQRNELEAQRLQLDQQKHQTETAAEGALAQFRHEELASNERIALAKIEADAELKEKELALKREELASKERIEKTKADAARATAEANAKAAKANGKGDSSERKPGATQ